MDASSNGGLLYHEVQEGKLCAVHCVNTALQGPFFSEFDLAALAADLDQRERQVMLDGASGAATTAAGDFLGEGEGSHNVSLGGDFSIQVCKFHVSCLLLIQNDTHRARVREKKGFMVAVTGSLWDEIKSIKVASIEIGYWFDLTMVLQKALEVWDLQVVPLDSPAAGSSLFDPELEVAFICHLQDHWFCIRKVNGEWYNFNSLYPAPEHLSKFYLSAYIDTLKGSGWSIFAVRGNFPKECPMATEGSNGFGQWLTPDDARRITASCNQVQTPTQQEEVSPLGGQSEGMSEMDMIAAQQEEADLNAAIAASLMDTGGPFASAGAAKEECRSQDVLASESSSSARRKDSSLEDHQANKSEASEHGRDSTEDSAPGSYPRERSPPLERK